MMDFYDVYSVVDTDGEWRTLYKCDECGALIHDTDKHDDWHQRISRDIAWAAAR